jgi:lysophospholipase L1-like esterase
VKRGWAARLALALVSSTVGLGLGELTVRALGLARSVGPSFTEYDAELGRFHKRSFRTTRHTPEFSMSFSTNAQGFRGPELDASAAPAAPNVLFLGDSFTEGYGVSDGEEFPQLVARALGRRAQVINAGVGDTGTGYALRLLESGRLPGSPRTVLVYQVCGNDFADNARQGLFSLDSEGQLVARQGDAPVSLGRRIQGPLEAIPGAMSSHVVALALQAVRSALEGRAAGAATPARAPPSEPGPDRLTLLLLRELLETARGRGWPVIVLNVELDASKRSAVNGVLRAAGATILDVPVRSDRPDLYFAVGGHWNRSGHAHAAGLLLPAIEAALGSLPR